MKSFRDNGIVLWKKPLKEKDELVVLLTEHQGKQSFISYGSRDPRSRKAGLIHQFNCIAFEARESKTKFSTLQQARSLRSRAFEVLEGEDLRAFYRASEMVKKLSQLLHDDQNVQNVYHELNLALDHIQVPSVAVLFWIRCLDDLGYLPEWSQCFVCDQKLDLAVSNVFCLSHRGFAHQQCTDLRPDSSYRLQPVHADLLKVMVYFQQQDFMKGLGVQVPSDLLEEMEGIVGRIEVN